MGWRKDRRSSPDRPWSNNRSGPRPATHPTGPRRIEDTATVGGDFLFGEHGRREFKESSLDDESSLQRVSLLGKSWIKKLGLFLMMFALPFGGAAVDSYRPSLPPPQAVATMVHTTSRTVMEHLDAPKIVPFDALGLGDPGWALKFKDTAYALAKKVVDDDARVSFEELDPEVREDLALTYIPRLTTLDKARELINTEEKTDLEYLFLSASARKFLADSASKEDLWSMYPHSPLIISPDD